MKGTEQMFILPMGSYHRSINFASMTTNLNTTEMHSGSFIESSALSDILLIKRCTMNKYPGMSVKTCSSISENCNPRNTKDSLSKKNETLKSFEPIEAVDDKCSDKNNNVFLRNSSMNINLPYSYETNGSFCLNSIMSLESIVEESSEGTNFTQSLTSRRRFSSSSLSSMSSLSSSYNADVSFRQSENDPTHFPMSTSPTESFTEKSVKSHRNRTSHGNTLSPRSDKFSSLSPCSSSLYSPTSPTQSFNVNQNFQNNANSPRTGSMIKSGCLVLAIQNDNSNHLSVLKQRSGVGSQTVPTSKMVSNNILNDISTRDPNSNGSAPTRCPVMVKIYQRSKHEKYAVVASTRRHQTTSQFYLRLKNARVTFSPEDPCSVTVVLNGADAKCYRFEASNPQQAEEWVQAFSNECSSPTPMASPSQRRFLSRNKDNSDQLLVISEKNEFRLNVPGTYDSGDIQDNDRARNLVSPLSSSPAFHDTSFGDKSVFIFPHSPTLPVLSEAVEEVEDDNIQESD